ncbi:MAG: site-specific recombinase, invertase Pin [Burkholderia sp.]|jgi:hypothetical protein|nr:site-specific recombinase, invertase Pin [Burkholderia sp.]
MPTRLPSYLHRNRCGVLGFRVVIPSNLRLFFPDTTNGVDDVTPELREAFTALGQRLPAIWDQGLLTREQQKALLRCLIDKVVVRSLRQ